MTRLSIDEDAARRFLGRLDPHAEAWCFRTIADSQGRGSANNLEGTLEQHLSHMEAVQRSGAGVFVVVNEGGQRKNDIRRVRAVFADTDGASLAPIVGCDLEPHLVVESSPGKYHVYWLVESLELPEFARVQKSIAREFGTDSAVCDLPRVMRLPGSWHLKGEPWRVQILSEGQHAPFRAVEVLTRFRTAVTTPQDGACLPTGIVAENRHADVLDLSSRLARLVVEGHMSRASVLASMTSERATGRWTRDVPDSEMEAALDGAIRKMKDGTWSAGHAHRKPEPLRRPVPPAQPYPVDALGPVLGEACSSMQRIIQAADAICGSSLLAAASLATQGLADVVLDGRRELLSLWFLTVAESGERKSGADTEALRPIRAYEDRHRRMYELALEEFKRKHEVWTIRRENLKSRARARKLEPGFDLDAELKALGSEPEAPQVPVLIVGDFTAEGLAKHLVCGRPCVGAFTDEAALVFGGHAMNKEAVARTAGTLSLVWDGGDLDRMRAGDGQVKLVGRRLASHLMAQPVIAERALADEVLSGQGFLARALIAWPRSMAGLRRYQRENVCDAPALLAYGAAMRKLLDRPLPYREGARNELAPRDLPLSDEAFAVWEAFHNEINAAMGASGEYADVRPWASKMPSQTLRIAGVLTLFDDSSAHEIGADTMRRAERLARWYLGEAVRLVDTAKVGDDIRHAEAVLEWCWTKGKSEVHSSELVRFGPSKTRVSAELLRTMALLERAGWAIRNEAGFVLDGAPRQHSWRILPEEAGRESANPANTAEADAADSQHSQVSAREPISPASLPGYGTPGLDEAAAESEPQPLPALGRGEDRT
jgi:hypothetical protein